MIKKSRGLSPVIATVLLIAMVVVIGLIVFLWFRGMAEETITKFGGTNIKLVCDEVAFSASYSGRTLYISNSGNVPIFEMKVKDTSGGSYTTKNLRTELSNSPWPESGLNQGAAISGNLDVSGSEITLIPVLLGDSDKGKKTYTCDEKLNGYIISV